jgi:hypothetical protein
LLYPAGPNPVIEQAFRDGYLKEGQGWKKMKNPGSLHPTPMIRQMKLLSLFLTPIIWISRT